MIAAMPLGIGSRQHRLADAAQPVQCGDRDTALVAAERRLDRGQRLLAAHEMSRYSDRDVGDRDHLARNGDRLGSPALLHELAEANARSVFRHAEKLATPVMIAERRQSAGLDDHEECEAGPLSGRLPRRGAALQLRIKVGFFR
jgi:hypothetical protein